LKLIWYIYNKSKDNRIYQIYLGVQKMTISRKLSLIAALGLNLGAFNASAYDVVGLKDEIQLISAFAKQHNEVELDGKTIYLGDWLNKKIENTGVTSNYNIIEIASLIKQKDHEALLSIAAREMRNNKEMMEIAMAVLTAAAGLFFIDSTLNLLDLRIRSAICSSDIKTLVMVDKMQQQIDELTQQVNKTWFQKLFAKA
jgi:hypothetical protein